MKIGILTLPLHTNYGGILQAYALQTVLERMGNDVTIIDKPQIKKIPSLWTYFKRYIKKYVYRQNIVIYKEKKYNQSYPYVSKHTQRFINQYIHNEYLPISQIEEYRFDAIVVGSDQIWRPMYYRPVQDAYLNFASSWNVKKIAYAVSFGSDIWEYSQKEEMECYSLIHKFNAISVREKSGIALIKKHFHIDANLVLDPTMLLDKNDYLDLCKHVRSKGGGLKTYILDDSEQTSEMILCIGKMLNMPTTKLNSRFEDYSAPIKERVQPPVDDWLNGLYSADFILTDSFHACVFSILFEKNFYVIANNQRGVSRITNLLSLFGLGNRIISSVNECMVNDDIDYSTVNFKLAKWRDISYSFLTKSLQHN